VLASPRLPPGGESRRPGVRAGERGVGVILGLFVGKTAGVLGATALAVRLDIGRLPGGTGPGS
jgi:hypothetical protein